MKIILKEHLPDLGQIGDIVNVADGYARNYLIPKGFAVEATKGNLNQFEAEKASYLKKAQALKEKAERLASEIKEVELRFRRKAESEERIFGSVTSMDIETALREKGFDITRKAVLLDEPIKSLGTFTVGVKLHPEVTAELKILVERE